MVRNLAIALGLVTTLAFSASSWAGDFSLNGLKGFGGYQNPQVRGYLQGVASGLLGGYIYFTSGNSLRVCPPMDLTIDERFVWNLVSTFAREQGRDWADKPFGQVAGAAMERAYACKS